MNKIIRRKNNNYTTVCNDCIRDKRLSLKAKGLMMLVMSLPDGWKMSGRGLASMVKDGKSAIYSAIEELKQYGYCEVITRKNERGLITGTDYTFYESPRPDFPYPDFPYPENRTQLNKDIIKERLNNNPPIIPPMGETSFSLPESYKPIVEEWLAYKKEKRQTYKPKGMEQMLKRLYALSGGDAVKARLIVEQSMANNWTGLFELKDNGNNRTGCSREQQRRDDMQLRMQEYAEVAAGFRRQAELDLALRRKK